ncbi:MobQ family relaxase [Rudaea sp.]|uniref:MobQ family relaxase n=1 Tax=Rudaea sp. TaxID=2136325 RepID=UPI0024B4A282|nr:MULTISPECIES: MobQ family relaxase [unclassified Rudaea]
MFHASLKVFSRSRGHAATAAAAYRAGAKIQDARTGTVHDYRHRKGVVSVHTFAPESAPAWASDFSAVWNAAERIETRKNAAVARELEIALPVELSTEQREALAADLSRFLVDRYGVAVTAAIHAPDTRGDDRNHHAHLLLSTRRLDAGGFTTKVRELDDRKTGPREVEALRAAVAALTNMHLERAGRPERVDHRTLTAQARSAEDAGDVAQAIRLTRQATRHAGKSATALGRRGAPADRAAGNEAIAHQNRTGLAAILAHADREGRLMPTPTRSGLTQARADRRRENVPPHSRTFTGQAPIRLGMAQGAGSQVLNEQARASEETLRIQADLVRDYLAHLDEASRRILEAYAQQYRLGGDDFRALARHCHRDARCVGLLRHAQEARTTWERAQTRPLRRRDAHGLAMVESTKAQRAWEGVHAEPQPKAWQRASRRQWAERRSRQRERLKQAQERERQAAQAVSDQAMAAYATTEREAREAWHRWEQRRRERYPLPSDPRPAAAARPIRLDEPLPGSPPPARAAHPGVTAHRPRWH